VTFLLLAAALLVSGQQTDRHKVDRRELAAYRLTTADFEQFRNASARIAIVIADDASFRAQPLFSEEITQSGDVIEVSAMLEARLRGHAGLSEALTAAKMSARDYTKCALTLVAARLALGFLDSGVLKAVPPGAAADNVAFVRAHRTAVDETLNELAIEIRSHTVMRDVVRTTRAGDRELTRSGADRRRCSG
jgi:hypothetical protein